jgi:hypothetical protein
MMLPKPRGVFSAEVMELLRAVPGSIEAPRSDPEDDVDAALALWVLYELSYQGFEEVPDEAEWHPTLLGVRHRLETDLERRLRSRWTGHEPVVDDFAADFFAFVESHDGPSLARHVQTKATRDQVLDLLRVRSVYHLKEADPTSWSVPRLPVAAKAALMELQFDEYGGGNPNRLHSHLFARGLEGAGLRSDYGAYVDDAPLEVLEMNNAMSLFGLHRRLRGAAMGHLAAFEATSSVPSRRMAQGLERLELGAELVAYYTEHVSADAVHDQLAVRAICGSLVADEPHLLDDVYFGAFSCLDLEARFASWMLARWEAE